MSSPELTIRIDGQEIAVQPGETILDVARRSGIFVPTLCHLAGATPTGACRICLVEVTGARALVASCAAPANGGMIVRTGTPRVLRARRTNLRLLLSSGNHNCAIRGLDPDDWSEFQQGVQAYDGSAELCPVYGECRLQEYAYLYQATTPIAPPTTPRYPMEVASDLIVRDFSRCIVCGRCVQACNDIQVNRAISYGFRGLPSKIVARGDGPLDTSDCVFCGECIQACPVGALVPKQARYRARPWATQRVRTTCAHCDVGCQIVLHARDGRLVRADGVEGATPSLGRLCAKGRFGFDFVHAEDRVMTPLVRQGEELVEVSWDEALDRVAVAIRETRDQHGPDVIGLLTSPRCTNETHFQGARLFRSVIGTPHIDHEGADAHPAALGALMPSPPTLSRIEDAACLLVVGARLVEESPVAATFVKRASLAGTPLVLVDAGENGLDGFASERLRPKEGTEDRLLRGLAHALASEVHDEQEMAATTGVALASFEASLALLKGGPSLVLYGPRAAHLVQALAALHGALEARQAGSGLCFAGGACNAMGACGMGALPHQLPGHVSVDDAAARARLEAIWGRPIPVERGRSVTALLRDRSERAGLRLLFAVDADPALESAAHSALDALDHLIVQASFMTDTARRADVVLPLATWAETDGTYTNMERRVSRTRRLVEPPGEARPALLTFARVAERLGDDAFITDARALWDEEIRCAIPSLGGIRYDDLEVDGWQWSLPSAPTTGDRALASPLSKRRPGGGLGATSTCALCDHSPAIADLMNRSRREARLASVIALAEAPSEARRRLWAFLEEEGPVGAREQIDEVIAHGRTRPGSLIPVLQKAQAIIGYLPSVAQAYVALGLGLSPADVFGVVSFYSFFSMTPRGRHAIRVCLGTACFVKGAERILYELEQHYDFKVGETTKDRMFDLEIVRCIGACGLAPAMVIDGETHGPVAPEKAVRIVETYRDGEG